MSTKRRDNKGRILRDGELQRKDGKYEYRYTDLKGGRHSIYSWRLVETDQTPAGKKKQPPLRELEKNIRRDMDDGIDFSRANEITLNQYYDEFIETKKNIKLTTLENYKRNYEKNVRNTLGRKKIASIRYTDILKFYLSMLGENASGYGSVIAVNTVLSQVFKSAIMDEIIRQNHAANAYSEVNQYFSAAIKKRHALSIKEQEAFINHVRNTSRYKKWNALFTTMFGTGLRFGEVAGLTWDDVDFSENVIYVRNNLQHVHKGKSEVYMSDPKSAAGKRTIPMLKEVRNVLAQEKMRQLEKEISGPRIDGRAPLVFFTIHGNPVLNHNINGVIANIVKDHNQKNKDIVIPKFSAHVIRHTFCTRMCENDVNAKVIQETMGHTNISMTMNVYASISKDKKKEVFAEIDGKMAI